jgi:mycothiol system anti-sigma-R factor
VAERQQGRADGVSGQGPPAPCGSPDAPVDCREALHELYHYLDGELTDEHRRAIAVHLDLCAPCADAAEFEAELRVVIAQKCRDHVPESLRGRIAAAIEEERRHNDHAGSA